MNNTVSSSTKLANPAPPQTNGLMPYSSLLKLRNQVTIMIAENKPEREAGTYGNNLRCRKITTMDQSFGTGLMKLGDGPLSFFKITVTIGQNAK